MESKRQINWCYRSDKRYKILKLRLRDTINSIKRNSDIKKPKIASIHRSLEISNIQSKLTKPKDNLLILRFRPKEVYERQDLLNRRKTK